MFLGRLLALVLACLAFAVARADDGFLEAEKAFVLSARAVDAERIEIRFDIAPGYYLYRDKISVAAVPSATVLGALQIPPGKVKYDKNFEKDVAYFRDTVSLVLSVPSVPAAERASGFKLVVGNQGCADKGLCYPPMERTLAVRSGPAGLTEVKLTDEQSSAFGSSGSLLSRLSGDSTPAGGTASASASASASAVAEPAATRAVVNDQDVARELQTRHLLGVVGLFLLLGLGLSFTPCVWPMLPILSSIIAGQSSPVSRARGLSLALAYSLGMATVYTAFGVAAALAGGGLGGALQNAWVLGGFGLLLAVLALSMFGVFELRLPGGLGAQASRWSSALPGGRYASVFVMGGLSAVIVSPCIAPPLAGALLYISQTGDITVGAVALFSLSAGMSVPLLVLGLSSGAWLPRSGVWMSHVKNFFGVLLLGVALWTVSPVLPAWVVMLLVALLLLGLSVYLGAFEPIRDRSDARVAAVAAKAVGLMLAALAVAQLVGVASGGRNLLQPLSHWGAAVTTPASSLPFKSVASLEALDEEIQRSTRPVMVDFYADWCVACKEFEALTLSQPEVRQKLSGMTLLRVDVTANNAHDQALLRRYKLFGPPALLFFAPGGAELPDTRVIGFQPAGPFIGHLDRVMAVASPSAVAAKP